MENLPSLRGMGSVISIEQLPDGVFVIEDGTLVYVNPTLAEMVGFPVGELIGRSFIELIDSDDRPLIWERHRARLAGEKVPGQYEVRLVTADGSVLFCSINITLKMSPDGRSITIGSARDVSERKAGLVELEASKAELKSFFERLPDIFYRANMQGLITMMSPGVFEVLGYRQEEILGTALSGYYEKPEERTKALQAILDGGGKAVRVESALRHKDGTVVHVMTNAFVRFGPDGQPRYIEGAARDVTERVLVEQRLQDSIRKLEEKELSKTRFLAAAGHDLRQPVAAANLFLDALKLTPVTPQQGELIARMDQSMSVFSSMLDRLLDISKFDSGLIKPKIASFDLAELFSWLEQNFARVALEHQLSFRLFFPMNRTLVIRTDIGLLQSVLMNLVSNAIKFTAHGGVLISARPRGEEVLLQVWDTGIGIADADLPHIFDEFYQVGNPQRSREAGLGLGLSICQRAMALLGGEVSCSSRPGRGSIFTIRLPRKTDRRNLRRLPVESEPGKITDEMLLQGKRVVVVEDDELVAAGMVYLLQGLGAEVVRFGNAEEALQDANLGHADFFVVDYSLGGTLTGLQLLQTLQQKQHTPIRAVVLTGETSSRFINSVADTPWPVLHKPVSYEQLMSALRQ